MGETTVGDAAAKARPTIAVPPRGSMEFLFANGSCPGFSPGPMTLVSSFFSEQGPFSFSQLLAGAMASPMAAAANQGFMSAHDSGNEERGGNSSEDGRSSESVVGYKRNRPMNLMVAQPQLPAQLESLSPLFMVPPGLSPSGLLNSPGFLSPIQSPFGMSHQQALAHVTAQAAFSQSYMQMQVELQRASATPTTEALANNSCTAPNETLPQQTNPTPTKPQSSKVESSEVSQSNRKSVCVAGDKPASDGYNWRKYGQKHVKTSECPRSYYKCTHLNCPVKKKVERSFDGSISEIVYKGQHNHDPPQPSKRRKDSISLDRTYSSEVVPVFPSKSKIETNRLSEAIIVNSEPVNIQANYQKSLDCHAIANRIDEITDTTIILDDEDDIDEPIAKKRIIDVVPSVPAPSHETITESKIVVQTRSEVDLLDDGYKWRKYGQKVVKGNPYPRSYYRCTYAGCNVRKHVERSSADSKAVITTYEGKHNHEIPVGRYSIHGTANAIAQPLKPGKIVKNPAESREMDLENKSQMPMTLRLKEEQIAA